MTVEHARAGLILAGDPDLGDLYVCEMVKPPSHLAPNPLVKVISVIRYPIQHAVMLPDVANENAPVPEGCVCRLALCGEAPEGVNLNYPESLRKAQEAYLTDAPPGEAAIVRRHIAGFYGKKRVLIHH